MGASRSIGQFYPVSSPVHDLDPRAKIVSVGLAVAGLLVVDSYGGFIVVGAAVAALVAASHIPARTFLRLLRPVIFIVVFTALFQVLFVRRGALLFEWGAIEVHEDGVRLGLFIALRVLLLVCVAGLLAATTPPLSLADGLEDLLSPLRHLRFPVHEVAMMTTIALRFVPTLYDEADKVIKAQAARGADFSEGSLLQRGRAVVPVLVPVTVGVFRRADELAEAMESRGYKGGEGRTRYRELKFRGRDTLAPGLVVAVLGLAILL